MDDPYLENLQEFVIDENRLVTYKWLSLTLKVPSNLAKQMLYHFVEQHKTSKNVDYDLHVTYFISGLLQQKETDENIHKICIVCDSELAEMKSRMSKIFSVHIYSVHKGKLKDLNKLYYANYDEVRRNVFDISQYSFIKCPAAKRRSDVGHIQESSQESVASKPESVKCEPVEKSSSDNENEKNVKIPNKRSGIASLFANQVKKGSGTAKPNATSKTSKPSNKKSGGLSAFLSKGPPPKPGQPQSEKVKKEEEDNSKKNHIEEENIKKEIEEENIKKEIEEEKQDIDNESPFPPKSTLRSSKPTSSTKKKPTKSSLSKRTSSSPKASNNSGKRRRIVAIESDSSSEESEDNHEESPLPPPPLDPTPSASDSDDEIFPSTPQVEPSVDVLKPSKGKRRKLVEKTYMDEDGYFVNKKEYQLVSDDSDNESPLPSKKSSPSSKENTSPKKKSPLRRSPRKAASPKKSPSKKSAPKKRKLSPVKGKQSSITNFFKKK